MHLCGLSCPARRKRISNHFTEDREGRKEKESAAELQSVSVESSLRVLCGLLFNTMTGLLQEGSQKIAKDAKEKD